MPMGPRGGYQAYSSMVFAQGGIPQQHVTANDMPSPETDVQRNDLAPDASLSLDEEDGGGMGSLTGWQALANEVTQPPSNHSQYIAKCYLSACIPSTGRSVKR